jgi:hypothetical protein
VSRFWTRKINLITAARYIFVLEVKAKEREGGCHWRKTRRGWTNGHARADKRPSLVSLANACACWLEVEYPCDARYLKSRVPCLACICRYRLLERPVAMRALSNIQILLLLISIHLPHTFAQCAPNHYPAPALSLCVPCATMFQWQIMGETAGNPIVSALVRMDSSSKHVQCVTTNGLDCHWGRSEPAGSINDTSTLLALGCDAINAMYFPLRVYSGTHWCNRVWTFLHKYCGSNSTSISPSSVRAKSVTTIEVYTSGPFSFGASFRECNGTIAGGHVLKSTACVWVSPSIVRFLFDSRPWNTATGPITFFGYRFVLGSELFLSDTIYNITILNNPVAVISISPPSSVVTFPITIQGINFPTDALGCRLSFDVHADLSCNVSTATVLISENLPLTFPGNVFLTQVTFIEPNTVAATRLFFLVVNKQPAVFSLIPTKTYGGGLITVLGENFVPNVGSCSAVLTTTSAITATSCQVATANTVLVQVSPSSVPSSVPGKIVLTFTVPPTTCSELSLQVLAAPVVLGPSQPFAYRSSIVTLLGTSFHPSDRQTAACFICSNASSCAVQSETTVVVEVNANPGTCDVLVKLTTPQMAYVDP